jgi:hypothetical protein
MAKLLLALLCGVAACGGGGSSLSTLTRTDVSGLPAGNAIGATVSGRYVTAGGVYEACHCRVGSCSSIHGMDGEMLLIAQQDGALSMMVANGPDYAGGVSQDGQFWLGGAGEQPGLVQITLISGEFMFADSQPVGLRATFETTLVASAAVAGTNLDCDMLGRVTANFVGL